MTELELEPMPDEAVPVLDREARWYNPFSWSYRWQCFTGLLLCAGFLGYALYVEHQMFMMPCPLCILQRVAFVGMGVFFLVGVLIGSAQWRWARRLTAMMVALFAVAGAGVAGWHLRLQYAPSSDLPSCASMDIGYMLDAFPLSTVVRKIFEGSGECAKIDWTLLGLSMPGWTIVCYVLMGLGVLWAGFRQR